MPRKPISEYEMTEDYECPYCAAEGRRKRNVCRAHEWCYVRYFENWREGLAR